MLQQGYYRFPTINDEQIIFVSEDDLWTVPSGGGIARRLTSGLGAASFPALSHDGKWVAFSGRDEGPLEAFVMPRRGRPAPQAHLVRIVHARGGLERCPAGSGHQ